MFFCIFTHSNAAQRVAITIYQFALPPLVGYNYLTLRLEKKIKTYINE